MTVIKNLDSIKPNPIRKPALLRDSGAGPVAQGLITGRSAVFPITHDVHLGTLFRACGLLFNRVPSETETLILATAAAMVMNLAWIMAYTGSWTWGRRGTSSTKSCGPTRCGFESRVIHHDAKYFKLISNPLRYFQG